MTFNAVQIADGLAERFTALAAPAGLPTLDPVRVSTADPPEALGDLPAVVVFADEGELETGNGVRAGVSTWLCRFYLSQTADLEHESRSLLRWLEVLLDRLKGAAQLGGAVARAVVSGYTVGLMPYSGRQYAGIELRVTITTSEAWEATA